MANQPPTRYVGPTEVMERHGKVYIFDAGAGEIIAELAPEAADAVRRHERVNLTFDGNHTIVKEAA